jgi:KDO2-lipid IV(A) lauroyltransferase
MRSRIKSGFIKSNVHIDHPEYLDEVIHKGKGGIIVSAHLGNWEMGGALLPTMGYPLSVVALAHKDKRVNALFNAQREAFGVRVIQTDSAVRRIVEHLKENRFVAILAERDFGNKGLTIDFWGRPAMIPKGAAFFSLKTGAPIIPIFFVRMEDGSFQIRVYPLLEPPKLSNDKISDKVIADYIRQYLGTIEVEIKKNPTQWLLFREFWQS